MIAAMQKENFKEEKVTEKFSIISNRISDYRLKPRDYAVYCCLVKHSDKNGVCFPSRRLIAEECCIDKKTVGAALRSLEKAGLAKKYTRITELTPEILHTFVSKIVIHERRERFKQNTEQQIDIYFRYIGNVAEM